MLEKSKLYQFDRDKFAQFGTLAGTDEVGRGPLAGPVVAAAVILDLDSEISGINDSKKLSEKKREEIFEQIMSKAISVAVTTISPKEIDSTNILTASLTAMRKSLLKLKTDFSYTLVDGNQKVFEWKKTPQELIIKGDSKSASIAAASIVAKVVHDRIMVNYHKRWPEYGFLSNKGYPTKVHREAVKKFGLTRIHRITFCENIISQTELTFF